MWDAVGITSVLIYGINVVVVKVALRHCGVLTFTAARWLLGGVLLLALAKAMPRAGAQEPPLPKLKIAVAAFVGVVINQIAFSEAVRHTTATDVTLIIGATPLVIAVWLALATREPLARGLWAVLAIGAAGLVLVVFGGGSEGGTRHLSGDALAAAALAAWAAYILMVNGMVRGRDTLRLAGIVSVAGGAMLLIPAIPATIASPPDGSLQLVLLFSTSAVLATGVATGAYYAALLRLGSTRMATFQYLQPFVGVVAAWIALSERLTALQLAGGVIVMLALWRTPRQHDDGEPGEPITGAAQVAAGTTPAR